MPRKPPQAPPHLPMTAEEIAAEQDIIRRLQQAVVNLRQRNLDWAVSLAIQAARGHGPLVDHFAEIGRRYGGSLSKPTGPKLRVVEGGAPKKPRSTVAPASEEERIEAAVAKHGSIIAAMRAGAI